MPEAAALEALLNAYRSEIDWLMRKAAQYESKDQAGEAKDHIHRARNLQATIEAYERIRTHNYPRKQDGGPVTLPLYVKRRDSAGVLGPATLCDSAAKALEIAAEYRLKDFADVWIEDIDGRRINETMLPKA